MGKDNIENKIFEKLNSRKINLDTEALWNELEPRLPNKRASFIKKALVLFLGIFILIFGIFVCRNSENPIDTINEAVVLNKENTKEALFLNSTSSTEDFTDKTPEKVSFLTSNEAKSTIQNTGSVESEVTSFLEKNHNLFDTNSIQKQANNILKNSLESNKNYLDTEIYDDDFIPNSMEIQKSIRDQVGITPILNKSVNRLNWTRSILTLNQALSLNEETQNKPKNWTPYITFSSSFLINKITRTNISSLGSNYTDFIEQSTSTLPGYQFDLEYKMAHQSGWTIGISADYAQVYEAFRLENTVSFQDTIFNEEAFTENEGSVGATQEININRSQKALNYNRFSSVSFSPIIGYVKTGKINYSISGGPILSIYNSYKGTLISDSEFLIQDLSNLYTNNGINLSGFKITSGISRNIGSKTLLGLNATYRTNGNWTSPNNTYFSNNVHSVGIGINVMYEL